MAGQSLSSEVQQLEAYSDKLNQQSKELLERFNAVVVERNALLRIIQNLGGLTSPAELIQSVLTGPGPTPQAASATPPVSKKKKRAVRKAASKRR